MLFADIDKMVLGKKDEILDLTIGKVRVVEGGDCEGCIVKERQDIEYKVSCHHICHKTCARPYWVKFVKEQ